MLQRLGLALLLLLLAVPASGDRCDPVECSSTFFNRPASTIVVSPDGGDFTTIADALEAATPGTTILLYPGTYTQTSTLAVADNNISIVGMGAPENTSIEGDSILLLNAATFTTTVIRNVSLVVTGANAVTEHAVYLTTGYLELHNVAISHTSAAIASAAQPHALAVLTTGTIDCFDCEITFSYEASGGATAVKAAVYSGTSGEVNLYRPRVVGTCQESALFCGAGTDQGLPGSIKSIDGDYNITLEAGGDSSHVGAFYMYGSSGNLLSRRNRYRVDNEDDAGATWALGLGHASQIQRSEYDVFTITDTSTTSDCFNFIAAGSAYLHYSELYIAADGWYIGTPGTWSCTGADC